MTPPTQKQMDQWCKEGERIADRMLHPVEMNRLTTWLFFTQPFRRMLVRLSVRLSDDSRLCQWIDDRLYPDDLMVLFR